MLRKKESSKRTYVQNREKIIEEMAYMRVSIEHGDKTIVSDLQLLVSLVEKFSNILNRSTVEDVKVKTADVLKGRKKR